MSGTVARGTRADMLAMSRSSFAVLDPSGVQFIQKNGLPLAVDDSFAQRFTAPAPDASAYTLAEEIASVDEQTL